jgi:hypothetical protein
MGTYFAKPVKQKNLTFESIERVVEGLNPNDYPTFDKTTDWAKTRHIYSEQICFHEKYYSWAVIGFLVFLLGIYIYGGYTQRGESPIEILDNLDN